MARRTEESAAGAQSNWLASRVLRLLLICCLLSGAAGGCLTPAVATSSATESSTESGRIIAVYPDPVQDGDTGEYVAVKLPTVGNWTLSDGETTVSLRNQTGRVVVGSEPGLLHEQFPNSSVVGAPLALSNAGETITLTRNGQRIDRVQYGEATEGSRYLPGTAEWRPRGYTPRSAVSMGPANATTFVLPDSPAVALETLRDAENRLFLAGYTFSAERVTTELLAAAERGVDVRVLVEASPVGGIISRQARLLDRLAAAGVVVRVVGGETGRYAFHHPKYAVVDDRALVLTENWKPSGTGGRSNRGWGVRIEGGGTADELAAIFAHDAGGPDTRPWSTFRRGRTFERIPAASGSYPTNHAPATVRARNVTVLTAPGNAEAAVVSSLEAADKRVDVIQPTLGRQENRLVAATLSAARRGVEVRILLSGAWYVAEENAALVSWLEGWADRNDAPLMVKLAEPGGRYETVHAKGLLVDKKVAVVGSLNWNRHSARENREVALALYGEEPVAYYRESFEADWSGGNRTVPWLYGAGAVAAVVVAGIVATRTLSFAEVAE
ncbi:phospholipase D/Transphosphatidylase [halophilic archaeon DL31]|nr:phospholipase D/Transphosphatidylase [halophilic archaeon DL31]